MYESEMSSRAGTMPPLYQPGESSVSSTNPVTIIVTPPTPIDDHAGFTHDDEDTHKEVIQLDNIVEEKEVYNHQEVLEEKQVYVEDFKEAFCDPEPTGVNAQHIDATEDKIHDPEARHHSTVKVVLEPQSCQIQPEKFGMVEKEVYGTDETKPQQHELIQRHDENQREMTTPESSGKTTGAETRTQPSTVQRHFNTMSQAVDKRKKAFSTFTTQSNTRLREGYAQMEQNVTDRSVAMEQGANVRLKRLGQGFSERIQRVEKGTSKRLNRLEKGFNDQVNRAEKSVDDRVTSLKQNISNVKGLGSNTKGQLQ
ncbi:hypothetical protein B0J13DRAFT_565619 [Dactylonectria estremocensis]|uniref:Uncharacterized protein n=1 Tax=Dactylonectria estremocensis TaxID=1079267 RepID=A0A9P9DWG6_9HYPO|nr:hypothetical protein B0J13DRAFT_565619 [Dactylonectria estremocensis]